METPSHKLYKEITSAIILFSVFEIHPSRHVINVLSENRHGCTSQIV